MDPGRPARPPAPASALAAAAVGTAPIFRVRIPGGGPERWKRFVADEAPAPVPKTQATTAAAPPVDAPTPDAGGPSDRIGSNYNETHGVLGPRLFSSLQKDPALNPLLPGATPARRVLFYGSLYTTLPTGVMSLAKNAAADVRAAAVAAKAPHVAPAPVAAPPSSEPPLDAGSVPDATFSQTAGGTAFATDSQIRAAGQAAREAVRAEVRAQLQGAEWEDIDGGEVEALLKARGAGRGGALTPASATHLRGPPPPSPSLLPPSQDPDFVRVDLSRLPVDVFDDSTFERAAPADWLQARGGAGGSGGGGGEAPVHLPTTRRRRLAVLPAHPRRRRRRPPAPRCPHR